MTNLNNVLNKYTKGTAPKFSFEKKDREFKSLKELPLKTPFVIEAAFVNTSGNYGAQGLFVTSDYQVNLPKHLLKLVEDLRSDDEAIESINHRELAFEIYEYESKAGHKGYSINLIASPTSSRAFPETDSPF